MTPRKKKIIGFTLATVAVIGAVGIGAAAQTGLLRYALAGTERVACTGIDLLDPQQAPQTNIVQSINTMAADLPYGEGVFWKIEAPGKRPSYLFGTMHLADPRLLDLPPKVEAAADKASIIAVEVTDVLNPKLMQEKVQGMIHYTAYVDGSSIEDRLTPEQLNETQENFARRSNIPWILAKRLKPWAMMGAMAVPACETARKALGDPVLDALLAKKAETGGKKLVALETLESQMKAMSSLPEDKMIEALAETSRMGDRVDDVLETMIVLYEQEKIGAIWAMMKHVGPNGLQAPVAEGSYSDFQKVIVDARNTTMVKSAQPLLQEGNAFIAVGALHLPGENGMLSILAQQGYTVSRP